VKQVRPILFRLGATRNEKIPRYVIVFYMEKAGAVQEEAEPAKEKAPFAMPSPAPAGTTVNSFRPSAEGAYAFGWP
jgi:hypothetical protein